MKTYLLALCLLTSAPAFAQTAPPVGQEAGTIEALDAKNGFRTFKFGTPIADIPNLIRRDGGLYGAPKESMKIGDIRLNSLRLVPHNGKLTGIILRTAGDKYAAELLDVLTAQYGQPKDEGPYKKSWYGASVSMVYAIQNVYVGYGMTVPRVTVYLTSNEFLEELIAEKQATLKKAADDL